MNYRTHTIYYRQIGPRGPGVNFHIRNVTVRSGDGRDFSDEDIRDATDNPDLRDMFARAAQRRVIEILLCCGVIGLSVLAVPFMVPIGLGLGTVGGLGSDVSWMVRHQEISDPQYTTAGAATGLVLGGVAGLLLSTAILVGALSLAPFLYWALRAFAPDPSDDRYGVFVHQYNTRLAAELGLDVTTLNSDYFPMRS